MASSEKSALPLPRGLGPRARKAVEAAAGDEVLARYFMRVDPQVAASFSAEQRDAIKRMVEDRHHGRHLLDFRHSLPLGRKRFYFVLLFGQERRSPERLRREGVLSWVTTGLVYCLGAMVMLTPLLLLLYALKIFLGIDLIEDGGLHGLVSDMRGQAEITLQEGAPLDQP